MKWPRSQVAIMEAGFRQFLENCGHSVADIRESYAKAPPTRVVYDIDRQVTYDLQYDNTHPAYTTGARTRRVDHCPEFELYPTGCNDTHRNTMLRHVGRAVGLIG